ncbi:MAG: metalloregulator ArsR/SmtB family transcription factor [Asticcacaulis sp.]
MLDTFTALADSNRLRIVAILRDGAQPVGLIAKRLGLHQPLVSKHLNLLKKARLVAVEARAQQRLYSLDPAGLQAIDTWLEAYRSLWSARFDQMDAVIADMLHNENLTPKKE